MAVTFFDVFTALAVVACTGFEMNANGWQDIGPLKKRRAGSLEWDGNELLWMSVVSAYWLASRCLSITVTVYVSTFRSCTNTYYTVMTPGAAGKKIAVVRLLVQILVTWRLLEVFKLARMLSIMLWLVRCVVVALASAAWRWLVA